jgi:tryptophan halogenase
MMGQGLIPEQYHQTVDVLSDQELTRFMENIRTHVGQTVAKLPNHQAYVEQYCKARA